MIELAEIPLRRGLVGRARSLAPLLRASADEIDEARQLLAYIVAAMKRAGLFRMSMPKAWGGWEAQHVKGEV